MRLHADENPATSDSADLEDLTAIEELVDERPKYGDREVVSCSTPYSQQRRKSDLRT